STRSKRATVQEEIVEPMEGISIDPPIISNFTENYPVNEEEDKRIEVEQEELIASPFIEEAPPVEEPKKKRGEKIVESLEGETQA
ncbi:hypothetical protein JG666_23225, partial [Vibrio cholerae]|nr:hypothetical protein [Vibrio cholerae]